MSPQLPSVAGSASTTTSVTSDHSEWNTRTVVLLGLGAFGLFFAIKLISDSLPSNPRSEPPDDSLWNTELNAAKLAKFISEQHKSGLRFGSKKVCVNEDKALPFEQFAEGFIRFKAADLDLKETDDFFIRCSENIGFRIVPFFKQTTNPEGDLEFFIPNLPLNQMVKVDFGTPRREFSVLLNVDQARGLYTIFKENFEIKSRSEPVAIPIIHPPVIVKANTSFYFNKPRPLPLSISLSLDPLPQITDPLKEETGHLIINNLGKRCVVYLQLTTKKSVIPADQRDVVVPLVINAEKTKTISKNSLDDLWKNGYQYATSRQPPEVDLELHLAGIQQIIYRNPGLPKA